MRRKIMILLFGAGLLFFMPGYLKAQLGEQPERVSDQIEQEEILAGRARRLVRYMVGSENVDVMVSLEIKKRTKSVKVGGKVDIIRIPGFEIVKANVIVFLDEKIVDDSKVSKIKDILPRYLHLMEAEVDVRGAKFKEKLGKVTLPDLIKLPYVYGTVGVLLVLILFLILMRSSFSFNTNLRRFINSARDFVEKFGKVSSPAATSLFTAGVGATSGPTGLSAETAGELKKKGEEKPFSYIVEGDLDKITYILKNLNNPDIAAMVINYISPVLGHKLLFGFEDKFRDKVISILSERKVLDADDVKTAEVRIKNNLKFFFDGTGRMKQMLDYTDEKQRRAVIDTVNKKDEKLAWAISEFAVTLDDIINLPPKMLTQLFRKLNIDELTDFLASLDEETRKKILSAYPEVMADTLKERIEYTAVLSKKAQEKLKVKLISIARKLDSEGVIDIKEGRE